jgi:tRNA threonylcarbamoyladenosine biosynthesis protein TsaE
MLHWSTPQQGEAWVKALVPQLRRPCLVLLLGQLGAGKTQVSKWFLREMGISDVASPTFAIHHVYPHAQGDIDHFDLYRLQSDSELEDIGFWDVLSLNEGLVFVEWADRLPPEVWPKTWMQLRVHLRQPVAGQDLREVDVQLTPPS